MGRGGKENRAHLLVNFSLLRHRLQTRKPESSPSTRVRLRAPPKMGHNSPKEAEGAPAPADRTQKSNLSPLWTSSTLKSFRIGAPNSFASHVNFPDLKPSASLSTPSNSPLVWGPLASGPASHSHPRQKSLCGRAGHDSQFMHLSRSSLQELPREQGVVPGEGDQRLGAGRGYSGG